MVQQPALKSADDWAAQQPSSGLLPVKLAMLPWQLASRLFSRRHRQAANRAAFR